MFESQMEATLAQVKLLLGGRLHRINHTAKEGEFSLDNAGPDVIQRLANLGRSEALRKDNLDTVRARLLNSDPISRFVPIQGM